MRRDGSARSGAVWPEPAGPTSIVDVLEGHASRQPDRPALVFEAGGDAPPQSLTYSELMVQVRAMAGALVAQNLAGHRVALLFAPGAEFVIAILACFAAGCAAAPLAPIGRRRERVRNLLPLLQDIRPGALLVDRAMADQYGVELRCAVETPLTQWLVYDDLAAIDATYVPRAIRPDQLAVLQFTSGSTSQPKGVMVTHGNLLANQWMIQRAFGHDGNSHFVGWAPHFHDQGLFGNIMQPLYLGSTCVLTSPAAFIQRPLLWLELIDRYRAHTSGGPNFAFDLCVEQARRRGLPDLDLSCWKVAFNGAERVRANSIRAFQDTFAPLGFRKEAFLPCFGLAECTLVTIATPFDQAPVISSVSAARIVKGQVAEELGSAGAIDMVCCGPAMEGGQAAIVDPESARALPDGEVGEIWLRGPHVAVGYWGREDETARTFGARLDGGEGPWLRTGDLGFRTVDGYYILGRLKDLIIVRGKNYAPGDVEQIWVDVSGRVEQASAAAFEITIGGRQHVVLVGELGRGELAGMDQARAQGLAGEVRAVAMERLDLSVSDLVLVPHGSIARTTSGKVRRAETGHLLMAGKLPVRFAAGPLAARLVAGQNDLASVTP